MFCYFVCVMPYIMILAWRSGGEARLQKRDRQSDGWGQLIWWNVIENEVMESNVMMKSEDSTSVIIWWSDGIRLCTHWVVSWRCLADSVLASSLVGRCQVRTKPGTAYLLYYKLLNFLFGIFDLFLDMMSVCMFGVPDVSVLLDSCGMWSKIVEHCRKFFLVYKMRSFHWSYSLSRLLNDWARCRQCLVSSVDSLCVNGVVITQSKKLLV